MGSVQQAEPQAPPVAVAVVLPLLRAPALPMKIYIYLLFFMDIYGIITESNRVGYDIPHSVTLK